MKPDWSIQLLPDPAVPLIPGNNGSKEATFNVSANCKGNGVPGQSEIHTQRPGCKELHVRTWKAVHVCGSFGVFEVMVRNLHGQEYNMWHL